LNSTTCQNSGNDQKSKFQCDHKTKFWQWPESLSYVPNSNDL
jgi:hypothetical protein